MPRRSTWRCSGPWVLTGLLAPVSTSAALADWAAATGVTPEHVAKRTGGDKGLAALIGATWMVAVALAVADGSCRLFHA